MESKQGGGEMTTDRVPGCCKYEKCIMRAVSGRYICSICDFKDKNDKVECRKFGFCTFVPINEIYCVKSIDKAKSDGNLYWIFILSNDCGDAIWVEYTKYGISNPFEHHPSTTAAYRFNLDDGYIDRDECLAFVENMDVDVAFDEIIRQLAINFDKGSYNIVRSICNRTGTLRGDE